jgi:hypothetical protein
MVRNSCPKCSTKGCDGVMQPDENGVCKCPVCGAAWIPSGTTGVFVPASIIGIHEKSIIGIHEKPGRK